MRAVSVPCRGALCGLGGHGGARGRRGWNGVATSGAIAAAPELPAGGFACSLALARRLCVVRFLGAEVTLVVARAAAPVWAISGGVALRCSPSRRSVCRWLAVSACDARARCGGLGRVLCAVLLCHAAGRLLPRFGGGGGGAVPTAALAAPGVGVASSRSAPWPMCRQLPGGLARLASASGARRVERRRRPLSRCGGGVATVTVVLGAKWTMRSCRVLARSTQRHGLVCVWSCIHGATHATHTTGPRAVMSPPVAPPRPHSARQAPPSEYSVEYIYPGVVYGPVGFRSSS